MSLDIYKDLHTAHWAKQWLKLAVLSLALSGVFSVILVVSRTPQLIAMVPWLGELFSVSLVIHVDLSVLVWFLSITGMLWAVACHVTLAVVVPFFRPASSLCVLLGMLMMALSPLSGEWEVVKSNYIPVITNGIFFVGLSLVFAGIVVAGLQMAQTALTKWVADPLSKVMVRGIMLSAPVTAAALLAFEVSIELIDGHLHGYAFYETAFWAGGHIVQFTYVQIMLVAWLMIAHHSGYRFPSARVLLALLLIGPIAVIPSVAPYIMYDISSQEHMDFFTLQMNVGLGIAGVLLGLWLVKEAVVLRRINGALCVSLLLFFVGGAFGALIDGQNVKIPAHYHGSIVAVTLALMGMVYILLPHLGYADVSRWRMTRWQPYLYGFGQLLHISGLAWSGGYGVLRKAVGDTGDGSWQVKAALGIMGGGGLLAIIGGLLFVIIAIKAFRAPKALAT